MTNKCLVDGLTILTKYSKPDSYNASAEHDVLLFDGVDEQDVSDEDKLTLKELGWFVSEEFGCWAAFV